jgi:molybdate-binding protein
VRFASSLESVVALCKGRCEIAGFHVPEGVLGREILRKYEPWLKPRAQRTVHFVRRRQGLMVAAGNPLNIQGLKDIVGTSARFINRQRGSGTHAALDLLLQEEGIERADINGYYTEEFTHLAVAAAIASGVADVGMGIEAAARRLKIDFIPFYTEDYYLLGKREIIERPDIENIISVFKSQPFADIVSSIPGYDSSEIGKIASVSDLLDERRGSSALICTDPVT